MLRWRAPGGSLLRGQRPLGYASALMHRARVWFAAHGITRIERIVTDNGACYRADASPRLLLG